MYYVLHDHINVFVSIDISVTAFKKAVTVINMVNIWKIMIL